MNTTNGTPNPEEISDDSELFEEEEEGENDDDLWDSLYALPAEELDLLGDQSDRMRLAEENYEEEESDSRYDDE